MPEQEQVAEGKRIYFASDFHFGIPDAIRSRERERRVCAWLDSISGDAQHLFLLGDLFDSWMEYKRVVPKGFIRFLGKLAELSDAGIGLSLFTGNHDLWVRDYFQTELGARVFHEPQSFFIQGKRFHIGHGDGVAPQERGYRMMKEVFRHPLSRFLYRQLHPDLGLKMADYFSRLGMKHQGEEAAMEDIEKEHQIIYSREVLKTEKIDYFIYGHRHVPCTLKLNEYSTFINLGDWIRYDTYAVFDGLETRLVKY
ncbi:MAG TPA: UDP-2,3-diacylglucosamine diphosphatase [Chitinophagaceae bacterium]|nr:UDP-2,3-diacylglucosamine diphosphatase [Chitinophagaceae bacterium]HNF72114.1 UDP-2,3-diacylglucosamine diphosphatase [Chitinophagaceae bacterium]